MDIKESVSQIYWVMARILAWESWGRRITMSSGINEQYRELQGSLRYKASILFLFYKALINIVNVR